MIHFKIKPKRFSKILIELCNIAISIASNFFKTIPGKIRESSMKAQLNVCHVLSYMFNDRLNTIVLVTECDFGNRPSFNEINRKLSSALINLCSLVIRM